MSRNRFRLQTSFEPAGDQVQAIERLVEDNIFELPFSAGDMTEELPLASLDIDKDIESQLLALKNELA